jgi:colicin import membrane protein
MRGPSLQKTALLSFSLHLTAFLLILLILRQSNHIVIPSPYTVNLVSPNVLTGINKGKIENLLKEAEESSTPMETPEKSKKEAAKDKELVEKKIAALQQKGSVEKKISDLAAKKNKKDALAKLRKIISLGAGGEKGVNSKKGVAFAEKGNISDEYYSKIRKEIWDQWYCPPQICKNGLQAVISIRIFKDGTVAVQGIEKSSGNALFDRAALKAIKKANPLSPPPSEMEIGLNFP